MTVCVCVCVCVCFDTARGATGAMECAETVCDQLQKLEKTKNRESVIQIYQMIILVIHWLMPFGCSTQFDLAVESTVQDGESIYM